MGDLAKGLVGLAALAFVVAIVAAAMGGAVMGLPAEAFSRASSNLSLLGIALMFMGKKPGP